MDCGESDARDDQSLRRGVTRLAGRWEKKGEKIWNSMLE